MSWTLQSNLSKTKR